MVVEQNRPTVIVNETDQNSQVLIRSALVFIEGNHTDNKGRNYSFTVEDVTRIVANTNEYIKRGGTVPILYDHNKSAKQVAGSVDQPFILRQIIPEDLPNLVNGDKLGYLVGRLGVFTKDFKLKDPEAIRLFRADLARTISPGIDTKNYILREISIVPTPAIPGLSMYAAETESVAHFASPYIGVYSLEEAIKEKQSVSSKKKDFLELAELLWDVLLNVRTQFYETSEMVNLVSENLEQFITKVLEMFNIDKELVNLYKDNSNPQQAAAEGASNQIPAVVVSDNTANNYSSDIGNIVYFL